MIAYRGGSYRPAGAGDVTRKAYAALCPRLLFAEDDAWMGSVVPAVAAGMVALAVSTTAGRVAVAQLEPRQPEPPIAIMSRQDSAAVPRAGALVRARAALPALDTPSASDADPPAGDSVGNGKSRELVHDLTGGTVAIEVSETAVCCGWSVPNSGFRVEVLSMGPDEVRIAFTRQSHESVFSARRLPGRVEIELAEDDRGD